MKISDYQINTILKACTDKLRRTSVSTRPKRTEECSPDTACISSTSRRRLIIDEIASNIVNKISRPGSHEDIENEDIGNGVFEKIKNVSGGQQTVGQESSSELIFKEIDDHGERIRSLSFDNPEFLRNKLT